MTEPDHASGWTSAGSVLACLRRPAGPRTRFAVVSDPHVATRAEGGPKLPEQSLDNFAAALDDAAERDVDAVLSPGDLTKDGEPWNFDAVDQVVDGLSIPFLAVPGNHDVPKAGDEHDTRSVEWFADQYGPGSLPFHVEVGGVDLFGVNSAGSSTRLADTHDGHVPDADRAWLAKRLSAAARPVVLCHHNLRPVQASIAAQQDLEPDMARPPVMREPDPLARTLGDGGTALLLTGHYHLPATGRQAGVREVAAPATCSFPQSYLLCDVSPRGTVVRQIPITDAEGLRKGHTRRATASVTGRGLTTIAAANVASFPLVDESSSTGDGADR